MSHTHITLPLKTSYGWQNVDAWIIPNIAPHLATIATFAAHKPVSEQYFRDHWKISNVETGMSLTGPYGSVAAAVRAGRKRLSSKTVTDVERAFESVEHEQEE
jgi:hypothetical protein